MRNPSVAVERHLKQMGIICFAIFSGVVIFSGVTWYLINSRTFVPPDGLPAYLGTTANIVGVLAILKAHFLTRFYPAPGSEAPEEFVLGWHKKSTLLGFALREGGALIALVGVLLTGQLTGGLAVTGLALVGMVVAWPRIDQLHAVADPRPF